MARWLTVLAVLIACGKQSPDVAPTPPPRVELPAPAAIAPLVTASNALGFDLWARVRTAPGNLAISPASITSALAMAWGGARGPTANEMRGAMHLEGDSDTVMARWGQLASALQNPSRPLVLRIANRLFGERTFHFAQLYLDKTRAAYGAALEPLDFKDAADTSRGHINQWVDIQTEHRIKELLPPGSITGDSRLVLVNAIYFLAAWADTFENRSTVDQPFTLGPGRTKPVPMMHRDGSYRIAKVDGVTVLELPYKGNDTAMLVALPDQGDGLAALESSLDAGKLAAWTAALQGEYVAVSLPRFVIDPASPIELRSALEALGMHQAFDPAHADFTAIGEALYLSAVFHKAFVKVDERGTEAAAATGAVTIDLASPRVQPLQFTADHPFLFLIVDQRTGLVLFLGRVAEPSLTPAAT